MTKPFPKYPIEIEGDSAYCASIEKVLKTMSVFSFCIHLFSCLPSNKKIVIRPFIPKPDNLCNASSLPEENPAWYKANFFPIEFTPGMWSVGASCYKSGPGGMPDEILIHEMLHAYRRAKGSFAYKSFSKKDKDFDSNEEIFAIVLTNIYLSEKGKTVLRKDHDGFVHLPTKWSNPADIMLDPDYNEWIAKFWNTDNELASRIAHSPAPFNPFREHKKMLSAKGML